MSSAHITVDGKVVLAGEFAQWVQRTPDFIADMADKLKPGAVVKPEPHMLALMATFSEAMARQADIHIDVSTGPGWWTLHVKER